MKEDYNPRATQVRKIMRFSQHLGATKEKEHGALSVAMADGIIGCPHQEGIDYEGEWRPVCEFWRGRDRTGKLISQSKAASDSLTSG